MLLLQLLRFLFFGLECLLHRLHLLFALGERRAGFVQFAEQQVLLLAFFIQCQAHHRRQIMTAIDLVGSDLHLNVPGSALVSHLVDVHRRKRQQADQQEIADNN